MNKKRAILIVVCLTIIFMVALLAIDTSVTAANVENVLNFFGVVNGLKIQSLFFENLEPRTVYHTGVMIAIASWICFVIVFLEAVF